MIFMKIIVIGLFTSGNGMNKDSKGHRNGGQLLPAEKGHNLE